MVTELRHGTFARIFAELDAEGRLRARQALRELALAVEKQAKINASNGTHRYRTPTPARPNEGPARISGTLVRSITHTPVVTTAAGDWECKVGMATGAYANYGSRNATSSQYASYLENGKLFRASVKYPFLMPAFKFATGVPARLIYDAAFGAAWRTIG